GRGIDIRLGEHTAAQEHGNFLRINAVIFCFATVDGFPIQRVPEDKWYPFLGTQVSKPVPGEDTFHCDHHMSTIGGNGLEQRLRACGHITMHYDLAVLTQDTDVHGAGMQIDAAVKWVLLGVEAHAVSSSCE